MCEWNAYVISCVIFRQSFSGLIHVEMEVKDLGAESCQKFRLIRNVFELDLESELDYCADAGGSGINEMNSKMALPTSVSHSYFNIHFGYSTLYTSFFANYLHFQLLCVIFWVRTTQTTHSKVLQSGSKARVVVNKLRKTSVYKVNRLNGINWKRAIHSRFHSRFLFSHRT